METNLFRWGVIGPGRIAHKWARGLSTVEGATLHAVASRNVDRSKAFAQEFHAARAYDSYEALVSDPEIDAVYVATPHRFHYENAMLCLDADKPVLCEKPLTVNAGQARELVEKARAKGLFLMEGLWTRYFPIYHQVRQWLDKGEIGQVRLLTSTFGVRVPRDLEDRLLNPDLAGGALLDMGVYNIAISQWVYGQDPQSFAAQSYLGETNVDELTTVNLHYEDGAASQFTCSLRVTCTNDLWIYGTEGHIRIHPMFWDTTRATRVTEGQELTVIEPFRGTGFEYEIEEAVRCIRQGKLESSTMPHAHTLANMELMDGIRAEIGLKYSFE